MAPTVRRAAVLLATSLACLLAARAVGAQTMPRPPEPDAVRLRIGPLWLNPTLALRNAGVDTNVFYQPESQTPERDFTIAIRARSDYWLRLGRTWLTGGVQEDFVWYQTYTAERSANQNHTFYWLVPFNRLTLAGGGNWIRARERPGYEIDARSQRSELAWGGVGELHAFPRTFIGGRGERRKVEFEQDAVFLGNNLRIELNRTTTTGGVTLRRELTPLTSVSLEVVAEQDRFEFSPVRDSDSTNVNGSVNFSPLALIKGTAQFGYRKFTPLDPEVPAYSGSTATVNLTHVLRGSTRLGLEVLRDLEYSFELQRPYYLQTGFTASASQQIYGPIDVEIRGGRYSLAYRERNTTGETDRVDHIRAIGGGAGYRVSPDLRVGFNVDRQRRESDVLQRAYEGLLYGFTVTYGL